MRVAVTGSTGLVGSALREVLERNGHTVVPVVRHQPREAQIHWDPQQGTIEKDKFATVDGVVHLAGENIAGGRWTEARKQRIRDSRVEGTRLLCEALAQVSPRPKTLVAASASGYYGDRGEQICDESTPAGEGFLAEVCQQWEEATRAAADTGMRVVHVRIGIVLSRDGGALAKMLTPFRLGLGGRVGSGEQYWSWIALEDLTHVILYALTAEGMAGPVNAVSPQPVTNLEFTKVLGNALGRPTIFPLPAFAARLALGEMADALLLASTRVVPTRLQEHGYEFRYADLRAALESIL
jgi:uncharacterized protein